MSDFRYINNEVANSAAQTSGKTNFVENLESMICDRLEGIEQKTGFVAAKAMLLVIFGIMTFDILFDGIIIKAL